MKHRFLLLLGAVLIFAGFEKACASNMFLNWNASTSSQVAGYYVYYGTTSGIYPYRVDAGNATSVTISNLFPGTTYYIAATSYDTSGNQSAYSSEISFTIPATLTMTSGTTTGSPATLQFPVALGHWCEVQATTDLVNWISIWQSAVAATNTSMQFTDPDASSYPSRFYRLVLH